MAEQAFLLLNFASDEVYPAFPRYRESGGPLPHLFTLTARESGGIVSVALSVTDIPTGARMLSGILLYEARTFLCQYHRQRRYRPAVSSLTYST